MGKILTFQKQVLFEIRYTWVFPECKFLQSSQSQSFENTLFQPNLINPRNLFIVLWQQICFSFLLLLFFFANIGYFPMALKFSMQNIKAKKVTR